MHTKCQEFFKSAEKTLSIIVDNTRLVSIIMYIVLSLCLCGIDLRLPHTISKKTPFLYRSFLRKGVFSQWGVWLSVVYICTDSRLPGIRIFLHIRGEHSRHVSYGSVSICFRHLL